MNVAIGMAIGLLVVPFGIWLLMRYAGKFMVHNPDDDTDDYGNPADRTLLD